MGNNAERTSREQPPPAVGFTSEMGIFRQLCCALPAILRIMKSFVSVSASITLVPLSQKARGGRKTPLRGWDFHRAGGARAYAHAYQRIAAPPRRIPWCCSEPHGSVLLLRCDRTRGWQGETAELRFGFNLGVVFGSLTRVWAVLFFDLQTPHPGDRYRSVRSERGLWRRTNTSSVNAIFRSPGTT